MGIDVSTNLWPGLMVFLFLSQGVRRPSTYQKCLASPISGTWATLALIEVEWEHGERNACPGACANEATAPRLPRHCPIYLEGLTLPT